MFRPEDLRSWNKWDFDNFKFSAHETFLLVFASVIRENRFDLAEQMLARMYLVREDSEAGATARTFTVFRQYVESLEARTQRLKLNRISLQADLLHQAYENHRPGFIDIMQADFIIYLRSRINLGSDWYSWWPTTLVYATQRYHPFEVFARSESAAYFSKLAPVLGVKDARELGGALDEIVKDERGAPRFDYHRLDIKRLANLENIAKKP